MSDDYYVVRTIGGLRGADERTEEAIRAFGVGEIVRIHIKKQRNIKFHRKYWSMINLVFENQELYKSTEALHFAVKVAAGWIDHIEVGDKVHFMPKSTSFAKMTEMQFDAYYRDAIAAIVQLLPLWKADQIDQAVRDFG